MIARSVCPCENAEWNATGMPSAIASGSHCRQILELDADGERRLPNPRARRCEARAKGPAIASAPPATFAGRTIPNPASDQRSGPEQQSRDNGDRLRVPMGVASLAPLPRWLLIAWSSRGHREPYASQRRRSSAKTFVFCEKGAGRFGYRGLATSSSGNRSSQIAAILNVHLSRFARRPPRLRR